VTRDERLEARAHFRYAIEGYESLLGFHSTATTHLRLGRARPGLDETR
jgi:hypothetical protein